jgi:hypothetical protein
MFRLPESFWKHTGILSLDAVLTGPQDDIKVRGGDVGFFLQDFYQHLLDRLP